MWLLGTLILLLGYLTQRAALDRGKLVVVQPQLTPPGWHILVALVALLASLGGGVLITLADRETPMPRGEPAASDTPRADPALP